MIVIGGIAVLLLTFLYVRYYLEFKRQRELMKDFRGPPRGFLGSDVIYCNPRTALYRLMDYTREYGGVVKGRMANKWFLFFTDPESVEYILNSTKHITKSREYAFLHRWLGTGLLTSTGDKWRRHRKMITPTFHFSILEQFVDVFNSCGHKLCEKLEREVGKDSFDFYPYSTKCTLDIICETAMGVQTNAQDKPDHPYVKGVQKALASFAKRTFSVLQMVDFFYKFSENYRDEMDALQSIHGFTNSVIRQRKREVTGKDTGGKADEFGIKKKQMFLDMLLLAKDENGNPFSEEEIREEVDTFVFEGHDTTGTALAFAVHCMAQNQDAQQKAYEELQGTFGDGPVNFTYQDLQKMPYLEMVIKETLRIYPSVPNYARELQEDAEFDGKIIPKGCGINIFAYGTHRNPKLYPEPERFIPERFLSTNEKKLPYAYIPFSAGSRNCIGQKFAMLELKATLAKILMRYQVLPAIPEHKIVLSVEAVLRSANGVRVCIKDRKKK